MNLTSLGCKQSERGLILEAFLTDPPSSCHQMIIALRKLESENRIIRQSRTSGEDQEDDERVEEGAIKSGTMGI